MLAVMVRRNLVQEIGFVGQDDLLVNEDQFFWIKLAVHGVKFCYLDEVLGKYRFQFAGSNSRRRKHLQEAADGMFWIYDWVEKHLPEDKRLLYPFEELRDTWRFRGFLGHLISWDRKGGERLIWEWARKSIARKVVAACLVGAERCLPIAWVGGFLSWLYNFRLRNKLKAL